MFEYTKESIINGLASEVNPEAKRVTVAKSPVNEKDVLTIERVGSYEIDKIVDKTIYERKGTAGKAAKLVLNCTNLIQTVGDKKEAGLYQLSIYLQTPNQFFGEFAYPNWYIFGKPILVGFEVTEEVANAPEKLAALIADRIKLAIPETNKFVRVSVSGNNVTLDLPNKYMKFAHVVFERYDPTACDSCLGEYIERPITPEITANVEPFATGAWIEENLRFPTYPNIRYTAINEEEYPIRDLVYRMYSFEYRTDRPGLHGGMGVGMPIQASTRHIWYVPDTMAEEFKTLCIGETELKFVEYKTEGEKAQAAEGQAAEGQVTDPEVGA